MRHVGSGRERPVFLQLLCAIGATAATAAGCSSDDDNDADGGRGGGAGRTSERQAVARGALAHVVLVAGRALLQSVQGLSRPLPASSAPSAR